MGDSSQNRVTWSTLQSLHVADSGLYLFQSLLGSLVELLVFFVG